MAISTSPIRESGEAAAEEEVMGRDGDLYS
jgi:hypothetical protein